MKITEYQGLDGVRQITYNSLNTNGVLRIYEMVYASLNELFPEEEARELRRELMRRDVFVHELTNAAYKENMGVPGFEDFFEVRYLDPSRIDYKCETVIYNDTIAFYTYGEDGVGLEIEDENFVDTQRQIFDELWRKAARPVIGKRGRSSMF